MDHKSKELKSNSPLNLLVAIPYCKPDVIEVLKENPQVRFLLDSGAFTAWKKGNSVELKDYVKFIENLPVKPWRYFTLDKIGDPVGTKKNFKAILKEGLKPIPIFTRGDAIEEIDFYYEHSDLLGVGGLVGTRKNKGFVKGLMKVVGQRPVHLLGFVDKNFLPFYKPYSCDSSSFAVGMLYGTLDIYQGNGRWLRFKKEDFLCRPNQYLFKIFNEYEEDLSSLQTQEHWKNPKNGSVMVKMGFKSWTRYSMDMEKYFGVKLFLAGGCKRDINFLIEAHRFWEKKFASPPSPQLLKK